MAEPYANFGLDYTCYFQVGNGSVAVGVLMAQNYFVQYFFRQFGGPPRIFALII
jgi:hypothetical protein